MKFFLIFFLFWLVGLQLSFPFFLFKIAQFIQKWSYMHLNRKKQTIPELCLKIKKLLCVEKSSDLSPYYPSWCVQPGEKKIKTSISRPITPQKEWAPPPEEGINTFFPNYEDILDKDKELVVIVFKKLIELMKETNW